jgi:hypothetical protein
VRQCDQHCRWDSGDDPVMSSLDVCATRNRKRSLSCWRASNNLHDRSRFRAYQFTCLPDVRFVVSLHADASWPRVRCFVARPTDRY